MQKITQIDSKKTALVIIDLQKGIVGMSAVPNSSKSVIENSGKLLEVCRAMSMAIFLVHVSFSLDGKDALMPKTDMPERDMNFPSDWSEFVPEMAPQKTDFVIMKHQWGAFTGTELDLQLRRRRIDTIILCGIATDIGVESTARFAYENGYNQIFVEDAMSSMNAAAHANSIEIIFPRMGKVRSTEEVVEALATK